MDGLQADDREDADKRERGTDHDPAAASVAGKPDGAAAKNQGNEEQQDRQPADRVSYRNDRGQRSRHVALDQREVLLGWDLLGELRVERGERAAKGGPDIRKGQGDRVLVLLEDRAVQVGDSGPKQVLKRAATDDPANDALDHGLYRDQVRLGGDQLVGDALRRRGGDRVVIERRGGAP